MEAVATEYSLKAQQAEGESREGTPDRGSSKCKGTEAWERMLPSGISGSLEQLERRRLWWLRQAVPCAEWIMRSPADHARKPCLVTKQPNDRTQTGT